MSKINITTISLELDCKVVSNPTLLSKYPHEVIYRVEVETKRLSGVVDKFLLSYSSALKVNIKEGDFISVKGDIRTLNKKGTDFVKEGFILAKEISILGEEPANYVNKIVVENAYIHEIKEFRKSYQDNDIDVITFKTRLTRAHSRDSYFTATAWGRNAVSLNFLKESATINFEGRLQEYVSKRTNRLYLCIAIYKVSSNEEVE